MLLHALHGALILRFVFPRAPARRRRELVGWWSAKLMRVAGVSIQVEGVPPAATEKGAMIAANHVSWLDMFALSSVRPTRFIAKSEIRDWPLVGWIVDRAGTIFIRREDEDGRLCREMAYAGDLTFPQSFRLVLRARGVTVRLVFAPAIETAGRTRREVAPLAEATVASLLGLVPGREPRTDGDPRGTPR